VLVIASSILLRLLREHVDDQQGWREQAYEGEEGAKASVRSMDVRRSYGLGSSWLSEVNAAIGGTGWNLVWKESVDCRRCGQFQSALRRRLQNVRKVITR
jgi:hypothetical protein